MTEHVSEWLNAYLDGELSARQRERMDNHLSGCPACQAELAALRRLSQAVRQVPLPADILPAERFATRVMLRLPRQQNRPPRQSGTPLGWWLVPVTLMAAWAFTQAVLWLSTGVSTAGQAGLLGEAAAWLAPESGSTGMLTGAFHWLGVLPGGTAGQVAALSESLGWGTLVQLFLEGGLGVLYIGWLIVWWLRRQPMQPALNRQTDQ